MAARGLLRLVVLHCPQLRGAHRLDRLRQVELLEKWARDFKFLVIVEQTQQIQQLIVARRILGLASAGLTGAELT